MEEGRPTVQIDSNHFTSIQASFFNFLSIPNILIHKMEDFLQSL